MKIPTPEGKSTLTIKYTPGIFYIGAMISVLSFVILAGIYLLYYKNKIQKIYNSSILSFKNISFTKKIILSSISLTISIVAFVYVANSPLFIFPFTSNGTINWYSIMRYPKQQDYFVYFFAVIIIPAMTLLLTLLSSLLLRKK